MHSNFWPGEVSLEMGLIQAGIQCGIAVLGCGRLLDGVCSCRKQLSGTWGAAGCEEVALVEMCALH